MNKYNIKFYKLEILDFEDRGQSNIHVRRIEEVPVMNMCGDYLGNISYDIIEEQYPIIRIVKRTNLPPNKFGDGCRYDSYTKQTFITQEYKICMNNEMKELLDWYRGIDLQEIDNLKSENIQLNQELNKIESNRIINKIKNIFRRVIKWK